MLFIFLSRQILYVFNGIFNSVLMCVQHVKTDTVLNNFFRDFPNFSNSWWNFFPGKRPEKKLKSLVHEVSLRSSEQNGTEQLKMSSGLFPS